MEAADQLPIWHGPKKPRPRYLAGYTYSIETPLGKAFVTINENGGNQPFEMFVNTAKAGSETAAVSEALGRLISYILRLASPIEPADACRKSSASWPASAAGARWASAPTGCAPCPTACRRCWKNTCAAAPSACWPTRTTPSRSPPGSDERRRDPGHTDLTPAPAPTHEPAPAEDRRPVPRVRPGGGDQRGRLPEVLRVRVLRVLSGM